MVENSSNKKSNFTNKWLLTKTSSSWLSQAIAHPIEILIDHAHCERKAAGFALQLMFRYISEPGLSEILSPIAREELEHFEAVLNLLHSRGQNIVPLPAPPYGSFLNTKIRKEEPHRMLDSFLVAGLIEARSHERMSLLALHSPDEELRNLYGQLLKSEARHFGVYLNLAEKRFERYEIHSRLNALAKFESDVLSNLHSEPRMHS